MNLCKEFSKKHPVILTIITCVLCYALMQLTVFVPASPLRFGIREIIMTVAALILAFIFMGKEKLGFSKKGFSFAFKSVSGYLKLMTVIGVWFALLPVLSKLVNQPGGDVTPLAVVNIVIAGFFVGIAEEFIFRGLIFGGLAQKFGNTKKGIILAAVISGLIFGAMHVIGTVIDGEVTTIWAALTAILKTLQCSIFGVVLAFIYYKTRNVYAVAAIHSLNDFLLFIGTLSTGAGISYVSATKSLPSIAIYVVFTLVLVPNLVKCIKEMNVGDAIPFDDDFTPRAVEFVKKSKKQKVAK